MYGAVASVLLQLPYFKHVFAFMGCKPAGTCSLSMPADLFQLLHCSPMTSSRLHGGQ